MVDNCNVWIFVQYPNGVVEETIRYRKKIVIFFQDPDVKWSEGEIESFKSALRSHGKNWSAIAEGMTASAGEKATPVGPKGKHNSSSDKGKKSAEQCKSFFFTHRKQQQLDKILIERKRVRVCTSN